MSEYQQKTEQEQEPEPAQQEEQPPAVTNETSGQDTTGNADQPTGSGAPVDPATNVLDAAAANTVTAADGTQTTIPEWASGDIDQALANGATVPSQATTADGQPIQLPPVTTSLATIASTGDPVAVTTFIQQAVFRGSDEDILALAASMPDLIATLPPDQQAVVGQALQGLGNQWDTFGSEVNPDAYARMQLVGGEWYHEQGVLGNDQYGVDTQQSLSVNNEHYDPSLMEGQDGVHTDMQVPGIFWSEQGNLGRYLDTEGVVYVGEDGLRIMRRDGTESVTALELEAMDDVNFFGPSAMTLEDGSSAALLRGEDGTPRYVVMGPDGVTVVDEANLPSPIVPTADPNSTRVTGQEVEVSQTNRENDGNLVGAAFTGGLLGPQDLNYNIDQQAAQDGGNVYGLVASGETLEGGNFTITQNVMGTGDTAYHMNEDGTIEVAGHWGAVLDGDLNDTSIAVGGETPGPILVNGDVGAGTEISGSTVIVHGSIDPNAVVTADTVLVVGEDGTTQRYDPETKELVPYDGETMRQDDPLAFRESLEVGDGKIDVSRPTTATEANVELGEDLTAGTTTTTTDGNGNTNATSWNLGVGDGQLQGSLQNVLTENGNERTGGASVRIDPATGAVTIESNGGYRFGEGGPQVTGDVSFTWDDGQVTGIDSSVGVNRDGAGLTVSAGLEDHDYAAYDGGTSATGDEVVTYGQINNWNLGAAGTVPAGPVTIGLNGEVERNHTTSAYTNATNLTGIDPSLAATDPAAFREAVAAQMAGRIEGISEVADVGVEEFDTWQVGDGLMLESSGTDTLGASLGVGVTKNIDVSVGLEHAEGRSEQVQMELVDEDPRTVAITVTNVDSETWNASLNGGPLGLSSENTGSTGSSVSFQMDLSTPEGRAAYETYRTTSILPGALDYAQANGLISNPIDVNDPEQMRAIAGQVNRAFTESDTFALGVTGDGATTYTGAQQERAQQNTEALSAFGFDLLSHELVQTWRDRLYMEDGGQETERSYNRAESGWFSSDTETTGIIMNPEGGDLGNGASVEMMLFAQENRGHIDPSELGPYLEGIDPTKLDPLTQAWLAGEVDDGSYDAVVSMGMALSDQQLGALDTALDTPGEDKDARTAAIDEGVSGAMDDMLALSGLERVVNQDGTVSYQISEDGQYIFSEIQRGEQMSGNNPTYDEADYTRDRLGLTLQGVGVDTAALDAQAVEIARYAHIPLEEAQMQVYQGSLNQLYDVDGQDENFARLSPELQTAYLDTAAQTLDNPWDALDLALDVPAGDARDETMRSLFATIEGLEGGNNAFDSFYAWTEDLDPQLRDDVRSSLSVRVYDRGTMDTMAQMTDASYELDTGNMDAFMQDYASRPYDPINLYNNDMQNQMVVELNAATELARQGNTQYLEQMLGHIAGSQALGEDPTNNMGTMFAALRDPALQGMYLDALALMDAQTAGTTGATSYTQQALAYVTQNPTSLVHALSEGNPETQAALLAQLEQSGVDVNQVLLAGGQQSMNDLSRAMADGSWMLIDQSRAGVTAVLNQFADDPALLQQATDLMLAAPDLMAAGDILDADGSPVESLLTLVAVDGNPQGGLDVVAALMSTSHAGETQAALLAQPELLFQYASPNQALEVLSQLGAAGVDTNAVIQAALAGGQLNPDILANVDLSNPGALGDLLADREQSHNLLGVWTPETGDMSSILLYAASQGPEYVTAMVEGYEASGHRPGDDGITNMLDAMNKGDPLQVALAVEALRTAGYSEEVAGWLANHGGETDLVEY